MGEISREWGSVGFAPFWISKKAAAPTMAALSVENFGFGQKIWKLLS